MNFDQWSSMGKKKSPDGDAEQLDLLGLLAKLFPQVSL